MGLTGYLGDERGSQQRWFHMGNFQHRVAVSCYTLAPLHLLGHNDNEGKSIPYELNNANYYAQFLGRHYGGT